MAWWCVIDWRMLCQSGKAGCWRCRSCSYPVPVALVLLVISECVVCPVGWLSVEGRGRERERLGVIRGRERVCVYEG